MKKQSLAKQMMMKRIMTMLVVIAMVISNVSTLVYAVTGTGTSTDPYVMEEGQSITITTTIGNNSANWNISAGSAYISIGNSSTSGSGSSRTSSITVTATQVTTGGNASVTVSYGRTSQTFYIQVNENDGYSTVTFMAMDNGDDYEMLLGTTTVADGTAWTAVEKPDTSGFLNAITNSSGNIYKFSSWSGYTTTITSDITVWANYSSSSSSYSSSQQEIPDYQTEDEDGNGAGYVSATKEAEWTDYDAFEAEITFSLDGIGEVEGSDTIIILDRSQSMLQQNGDGTYTTTWFEAVDAVEDLVDSLLDDEYDNNRVALVMFNDKSAAASALSVDFQTTATSSVLYSALGVLPDDGTDYGTAFDEAMDIIEASYADYNERELNIVFISDGKPKDDDNYTSGVSGVAEIVKEVSDVNIYTIGIGLSGSDGTTYLKPLIKGEGTYTAMEDASDLDSVLQDLASSFNIAATNAVVTDTISQYFEVDYDALEEKYGDDVNVTEVKNSDGTTTVTVEIESGNISESTKEITIPITLKEEYQNLKGTYPTNGDADVTYTDIDGKTQTIDLDSPKLSVSEGEITIEYYAVNADGEYIHASGNGSTTTTPWTNGVQIGSTITYTTEINGETTSSLTVGGDEAVYYTVTASNSDLSDTDYVLYTAQSQEVGLTQSSANKTVYFKASTSYDVTFLNADGSTISTVSVPEGVAWSYVTQPETPTKDADAQYTYTFAGWDLLGSSDDSFPDYVTEDLTYQATFTTATNTYTVYFYDESGTTLIDSQTVAYGTNWSDNWIPTTGIPEKTDTAQYDYTFAGFSNSKYSESVDATYPTAVTGNVSYYAAYSKALQEYTVTFYAKDGTTVIDTETVSYGDAWSTVTEPDVPEITGYEFTGWDNEPADDYVLTSDYAVTAEYEVITYSITYNYVLDGVTVTGNVGSYTVETDTFTINNPSKTGYTFKGWEGTEITTELATTVTITKGSTGDRTYTANWDIDDAYQLVALGEDYTGVYDATSHAIGSVSVATAVVGEDNALAADQVVKLSYTYYPTEADAEAGTNAYDYTAMPTITNVGTSSVWVVVSLEGYHDAEPVEVTGTVTKATLYITAEDQSIYYGDAIPTLTYNTLSPTDNSQTLLGSDTFESIGLTDFTIKTTADANSSAGSYLIDVAGSASVQNYNIVYVDANLTIQKATSGLTVSGTGIEKTYNNDAYALVTDASTTSDKDAGTVTYYYSVDGGTTYGAANVVPTAINADTYKITVKAVSTNYADATCTVDSTILQKVVTVTAGNGSMEYGTDPASVTLSDYSVSGLVADDGVSVTKVTQAPEDVTVTSPVGTGYTTEITNATLSGDASSNYTMAYADGTFKIVANSTMTIDAESYSWTYDATSKSLVKSASSNVLGATITYAVGGVEYKEFPTATDAGTYTITVTATADNYTSVSKTITAVVSPATVVISAVDATMMYGADSLPTFDYNVGDMQGNDTFAETVTLSTTATVASDAGDYAITASGVSTVKNYNVTYKPATLTITDNDTLSAAATGYTYSYNSTARDAVTVATTNVAGATVYYSFGSETESDDNWSTTMPTVTNAGTYYIYLKATADNYTTYESTTPIVTVVEQAVITVTADDATMMYGTDAGTIGYEATGIFESDKDNVSVEGVVVATDATSTSPVSGTYKTYVSNQDAVTVADTDGNDNYSLVFVDGKMTIEKSTAMELTATGMTYDYDSTAKASATASTNVSTATITYSVDTVTNAGTYPVIVTATDDNYVTVSKTVTTVVNQAEVIITAGDDKAEYNTEIEVAQDYEVDGLYDDGAVVTGVEITTDAEKGSPVGTEYTTTASGADALSNYYFTYKDGAFEIYDSNDLIVEANSTGWTYDGNAYELVTDALATDVDGVKVTYSLDGETWVDEIPTATAAGTYYIMVRAEADNYVTAETTVTTEVLKAQLYITAESKLMEYGTAVPALTYLVGGLVDGDTVDSTGLVDIVRIDTTATTISPVGEYGISLMGLAEIDNYTIDYTPASITVYASDDLAVTATGTVETYNADAHNAVTGVTTSIPDADVEYSLDGGETWVEEIPTAIDAGEYEVTVRATKDGYEAAQTTVIATIVPATVTITVDYAAKLVGDADPTFAAVLAGLLGLDSIDYTVVRADAGEEVGDYGITASYIGNSNYTVVVIDGVLTIYADTVVDEDEDDDDDDDTTVIVPTVTVPGTTDTDPTDTDPTDTDTDPVDPDASIDDADVPLDDGDADVSTDIEDEEVPLSPSSSTSAWALVNLILAILTTATSLVLLIGYCFNRKPDNEEEDEEATEEQRKLVRKNKGLLRVASIIPALVAIIVFILTEDMTNPMIMIDRWTLSMLIIALVQVVVAFASRKKDIEDDEDEDGQQQAYA